MCCPAIIYNVLPASRGGGCHTLSNEATAAKIEKIYQREVMPRLRQTAPLCVRQMIFPTISNFRDSFSTGETKNQRNKVAYLTARGFFRGHSLFYQDTIPTGLVSAEQNAIYFSDEAGKSLPEGAGGFVKKLQLQKIHD
jgi:hypothetical protein